MRDRFEQPACGNSLKAKWVKPAVRQLRAGSAETGAGNKGDNAGGGNIHS